MKTWIFQANPERYDIQSALADEALRVAHHWTIKQHGSEIRKGDICLIWMSGKPDVRGIYAVGKIETDPTYSFDPKEESRYWQREEDRDKRYMRVKFVFTHKLLDNPILIGEIKNHKELRNLSIIRQPQCSNSPVTASEWAVLDGMIENR